MAEEMQQHLDLLTERNIAAGVSPNETRNAALRQFGGIEQTKEIAREQVWRWADEFVQDIRFGARMLWRNPGSRSWQFSVYTSALHKCSGLELDRRDSDSLSARRA
jgi:hypothetical protein